MNIENTLNVNCMADVQLNINLNDIHIIGVKM